MCGSEVKLKLICDTVSLKSCRITCFSGFVVKLCFDVATMPALVYYVTRILTMMVVISAKGNSLQLQSGKQISWTDCGEYRINSLTA